MWGPAELQETHRGRVPAPLRTSSRRPHLSNLQPVPALGMSPWLGTTLSTQGLLEGTADSTIAILNLPSVAHLTHSDLHRDRTDRWTEAASTKLILASLRPEVVNEMLLLL